MVLIALLNILQSLSNNVSWPRMSTGSGLFAILGCDFDHIFRQIVSMREKAPKNTNLVASRHIRRENASLPVDVRHSKTSLLKLPININS